MTTKKTAPKATDTTKDKPSTATSAETKATELADEDMSIAKVSGDDGTDSAENSANKDVAEAMREDDGKKPEHAGQAFPGEGGAAGI